MDSFADLNAEQKLVGRILGADWSAGATRIWPVEWLQSIRWTTVPQLAWQYKIRPMVAAALREAGWPGVPAPVRALLEAAERDCVLKGMRQVSLLRDIAVAASARDLRFMVMKGVALSAHLYGDPLIREAFDLDLLVHPDDRDQLDDILTGLGFRPALDRAPLTARQEAILARFHHDLKFFHPASGVVVERHHALSSNVHLIASDFDGLWARRDNARVADFTTPILGEADLAHYLAVHAARHVWERWKWIADLAALYSRAGDAGLRRLRNDIGWAGLPSVFHSSLLLVTVVTGLDLPTPLVRDALRDRKARQLAGLAMRMTSTPHTLASITSFGAMFVSIKYKLRLKSHPAYWAFELAALFHHEEDWYRLRLPDRLIPLYYLAWPFLFVERRVSSILKSFGGPFVSTARLD